MRPDSDIKRDVEEELRWDPKIDIADIIGVAVKDGVVTLTGVVRNYSDMLEAEEAAKRVAGVIGLANDLEVRLPGRPGHDDHGGWHGIGVAEPGAFTFPRSRWLPARARRAGSRNPRSRRGVRG